MEYEQIVNDLFGWMTNNKNKTFESPRKNAFGKNTLSFSIGDINDSYVKIKFTPSGTNLPLERWRFVETVNMLSQNNVLMIGARMKTNQNIAPKPSIEGHLNDLAEKKYGRGSDTKTAPHICDLLVLAGIAKYCWTENETGRKVEGVSLFGK